MFLAITKPSKGNGCQSCQGLRKVTIKPGEEIGYKNVYSDVLFSKDSAQTNQIKLVVTFHAEVCQPESKYTALSVHAQRG